MSIPDIVLLVYLGVAALFAVIEWIDQSQVHYIHGAPSGLLTGLTWPLWGTLAMVVALWLLGEDLLGRSKGRP